LSLNDAPEKKSRQQNYSHCANNFSVAWFRNRTSAKGLQMWYFMGGAFFLAWLTHIFVCIKAATWGLLIAGAIMFPIGIIHGIGVWLGVW
jgi:hypothetical protein